MTPLKAVAEKFPPNHPFRLVVLAERDAMPLAECARKALAWFDLLKLRNR